MSGTVSTEASWADGPGILDSMWRYRYAIVIATIVSAAVGFLASTLLPTTYEATAAIVVADADTFDNRGGGDPERQVQQEANRLTSRAVFRRAASQLGEGISAGALKDDVEVNADPVVGLLEVTASADDADEAAAAANAVVEAYERIKRQSAERQVESAREVLGTRGAELRRRINELQPESPAGRQDPITELQLETLRTQLAALEARISEIAADAALFGSGIDSIEDAVPPSEPSAPKPVRNAALAGVLGLGIASALAYWRTGVVDRSKFDLTTVLEAPLLAEIPQFSGGAAGDPLFDFEAAEAYQFLLSSVEYVLAETDARSVLITSASAGDGKSLTALHLAKALAIQGRNVVLVDADIRARGLTALLRADDQPGLVALADGEDLGSIVRRYRISQSVQLPVIPAGKPPQQLTGLLATDRYRAAIARIVAANELTIIDSGPLLRVADASAVATQVAGIILVLDAGTQQEDVLKVQNRLRLVATPLLGIVLNRVPNAGQPSYPYRAADNVTGTRRGRGLFSGRAMDDPSSDDAPLAETPIQSPK